MLGEIDGEMQAMTRAGRIVAAALLRSPCRLLRNSIGTLAAAAEVIDSAIVAPIKSGLAQLAIVDVLAVGVALSRGPGFQLALGAPGAPRLQSAR